MSGGGEMSPAAKALLQAAREGMTPNAAALARVKAKVAAGGVATAAGASIAVKIAVAVAVAGVAVGGVALALHQVRAREAVDEMSPPALVPALSVEQVRATPESPTLTPTPTPTPTQAASAVPVMAKPHVRAVVTAPVVEAEPPVTPPPAHATLAREVSLVDSAQAELHSMDLATALSTIATYDTETAGNGQLAEDAAAITVEALCRLHDPRAAAHLAAFDAQWPSSAQRARLSGVCK